MPKANHQPMLNKRIDVDGLCRIVLERDIRIWTRSDIVSKAGIDIQGGCTISSSREYTTTISEKSSISIEEATCDTHRLIVYRIDTRNEDSAARHPRKVRLRDGTGQTIVRVQHQQGRGNDTYTHMVPTQSVSHLPINMKNTSIVTYCPCTLNTRIQALSYREFCLLDIERPDCSSKDRTTTITGFIVREGRALFTRSGVRYSQSRSGSCFVNTYVYIYVHTSS